MGKAIGLALLGMVEKSGTASVVGPDGRFLYVINGRSDDLTIIDTEQHAIVDHIATGGGTRAIFAPPGVESLYVKAKDHLARIDTATNILAEEIPIAARGETRGVVRIDTTRRRIFLPHGTKLDVIDAVTGKRVASVALPLPVSMISIVESGEGPHGDGEGPVPPGNP